MVKNQVQKLWHVFFMRRFNWVSTLYITHCWKSCQERSSANLLSALCDMPEDRDIRDARLHTSRDWLVLWGGELDRYAELLYQWVKKNTCDTGMQPEEVENTAVCCLHHPSTNRIQLAGWTRCPSWGRGSRTGPCNCPAPEFLNGHVIVSKWIS